MTGETPLLQVWTDGIPWAHTEAALSQAAWRLAGNGVFHVRSQSDLGGELRRTLASFFNCVEIWSDQTRARERRQSLLHAAHQLDGLNSARELLEFLVGRAYQWVKRPCAIRYGTTLVGNPNGKAYPFAGGTFYLESSGIAQEQLEELQLWLLLGANALERFRIQSALQQNCKLTDLGRLAAGVAHELNTPLGAVSVALGLARRNLEKDPTKAQARLDMAAKSVDQMGVILARLLDYSRSSSGEKIPTLLAEVVLDSVQLVAPTFKLEGVELDYAESAQDIWVLANSGEIQQVLLNLLGNARQAVARQAGARVRVSMQPGRVLVEDNGPGVDAENLQMIFEPFFTTREAGQGVGLGLSVSREIIEKHQGELCYRASELGGACFEIRLPEVRS